MSSTMQFAGIFALLCAFMYLPTLYASALHSAAMKQLMSADAEPEVAVMAAIEGASTVLGVINEGREFFKNIVTKDFMKTEVIPYHCDLAPSLGTLTVTAFKEMDHHLQVMIATSKNLLEKLIKKEGAENLKFDDYMSAMLQNHFVEKKKDGYIFRDKYKEFEYKGISKGHVRENVAMKVESWFKGELLNDTDVYKSTKIDLADIKNVVSATGIAVESFATLFYAHKMVTRDIVDVGILRYPDPQKPYFKLYRIKLFAFSDARRYVFYEETLSGIGGTFHLQNFVPRAGVINEIDPKLFDRFIDSAIQSLFD